MPREGGSYEIRVRGRLSDSLVAAFEGMRASVEPVETVLHGPVQDQAALYGLLDRIQALGLELVEVRRLPDPPGEPETTRSGCGRLTRRAGTMGRLVTTWSWRTSPTPTRTTGQGPHPPGHHPGPLTGPSG